MTSVPSATVAEFESAWARNYDQQSQEFIDALSLPASPRMLDVGAGSGSMSAWFHDQYDEGSVVALDIEDAGLSSLRSLPRCEVVRADATVHAFEPARFDLVFVRAVLSQIAQPLEALERWCTWLREGGVLVVEDFYFLPPEDAATELGRTILEGHLQVALESGADWRLGRRLPSLLARAGLRDVGSSIRPLGPGQGAAGNALMNVRMRVERDAVVERELLTDEQISAWLANIDDPTFQDITALSVRAWGARGGPGRSSVPG